MSRKKLLAAVIAVSFVALPAVAQTTLKTQNAGHRYQGGPNTQIPHSADKKAAAGSDDAMAYFPGTKTTPNAPVSAPHQYRGGPRSIH